MNVLASFRYLIALKKHQHFGRAAQACHITQPALSNALRTLEEDLGAVIINRGRTFGGFTVEGELILQSAERMLREVEMLQQELKSTVDAPMGVLHIGAIPTAMPIAARFAAKLQAVHPGIKPILLSLSSTEIEKGLDSLSLDIGLGYTERLETAKHKLVAALQYTERYFFLRRASLPQASQMHIVDQGMSWTEAAQHPLCLLSVDMHNRTVIDRAFASVGIRVAPVMETNSILALALSVLEGKVNAILPGAMVSVLAEHSELESLPMVEPDILTPIGFLTPESPRVSRAMRAALDYAASEDWKQHMSLHSGLLKV